MAASKRRPDATKTNILGLDYLEEVRQLHEARSSLDLLLLCERLIQSLLIGHTYTGYTGKCCPAVV